jgi:hypothetical protein
MLASGERTCIDCHKGIAHKLPALPVTTPPKRVSMASPWLAVGHDRPI